MAAPAWLAALEPHAPDVVAVWRTIDDDQLMHLHQLHGLRASGSEGQDA